MGYRTTALPARPAPAAPNRDPIIATPAVDPRAAAPAVPIMAPAPAATNGAASPPVNPDITRGVRQQILETNGKVKGRKFFKEGNLLFNDALNTFFIYSYMVKFFKDSFNFYGFMALNIWLRTSKVVRKEMFYLMMHSTYFIYGYMTSDCERKPAAATWAQR